MPKRQESKNNLRLAGVFLIVVFGLIILSLFFKLLFVFKESKFDGNHRFIVGFVGKSNTNLISFSPQNKSISLLKIQSREGKTLAKKLLIPVNGVINSSNDVNENNISSTLLKSILPLGNEVDGLTFIDLFKLSLFTKSVPLSSVFNRELSDDLSESQKATVLSLSFTDPQVYQEGLSIEIVNATDEPGLGTRLASLITNIGGNVVLVSSADKTSKTSKIIYYKKKPYTVESLSSYLGFPSEEEANRRVADVIIIIGTDSLEKLSF